MDLLTTTAAAGLRSRLEALDLLANNLANSSTPGFKADREAYSLYLGPEGVDEAAVRAGAAQVVAPVIDHNHTDLRQGQLIPTGNQSDLALSGPGFFLLNGPRGPLLTRAARFRVSAEGRLTSPEGYEFSTVEGRRIKVDPLQPVQIDRDGTIRQDAAALGRLKVVDPDSTSPAPKREGLYFVLDSGIAGGLKSGNADIHQGQIEAANISLPETAVRLINVLRQFESLNKAIQLGGEMGRRAVEEVARVNP